MHRFEILTMGKLLVQLFIFPLVTTFIINDSPSFCVISNAVCMHAHYTCVLLGCFTCICMTARCSDRPATEETWGVPIVLKDKTMTEVCQVV